MEPDVITRLTEIEARSKSNTKRLDKLETDLSLLHDLSQSVAVMAESVKNLTTTVQEVKSDVQAIKSIPAKRWESVVEKIFFGLAATALGALVTFAVTKLVGG